MLNPLGGQNHNSTRTALRLLGPLLALAGITLIIIGTASLFMSAGTFEEPHFFWCAFVGMPILFVGAVLSGFGYMGVVARYQAAEMTSITRDTFNTLAQGTRQGMRDVAAAVRIGLDPAGTPSGAVACSRCRERNVADARFCRRCGAKLRA